MYFMRDWEFVNPDFSPIDTFNSRVNFSITQIIFQGGKSFLQRALNAISTESVRIDALAEYFNVLDNVDNAYYAVLEALAALEAEENSLQTSVLSLSVAEIRQASGMINQGDYLKALADREAREYSRNNARRNLALSVAKLKNLTGISGNFEPEQIIFNVYDDVILRLTRITDEESGLLFDELWKILISSNPSFSKAVLNTERAEKNLTITKRDFAPTISATLFSTRLTYSAANGFDSSGSMGVTISGNIPVDFWIFSNRIQKSTITRDSSLIDLTNAEISLGTDLQSALLNLISQAGSVLSSKRSLEYTERHFEFVLERFRLAQSSVSDLQDASSLLITSRNNNIRAKYGFLQNLSRLRSLAALDDEEKLLSILLN
jgi:outer membrane protein TolC